MSNPISYFFVLSDYERNFRESWLRQALPAGEYGRVWNLHITFLKELYPAIYAYGPNGVHVDALIAGLANLFNTATANPSQRAHLATLLRELADLFNGRFPLRADVLQALQADSRVMEIYLYSPHATGEPVNTNMQRLLDATAVIDRSSQFPPALRENLTQNLESLLSIAAAVDLIIDQPGYEKLYARYLALLTRWELPQASPVKVPAPVEAQESLSYITDH